MNFKMHYAGPWAALLLGLLETTSVSAKETAEPAATNDGEEDRTATPEPGPPPARFGDGRGIVISGDAELQYSNSSPDSTGGPATTWFVAPALDFFAAPHFSVGGAVFLEYDYTRSRHMTTAGVGPRFGYDFTLSDDFSIWPKVGVAAIYSKAGYGTAAALGDEPANAPNTFTGFSLNLYVPLMFHPAPHVLAGLGPYYDMTQRSENKTTTLGARLTVGGWFLP